ncbi:MAG: hypothetical protein V1921_03175 [Candidatus Altiarchaeota archaeon]
MSIERNQHKQKNFKDFLVKRMEEIDREIEKKNRLLDQKVTKLEKIRKSKVILFFSSDAISKPLVSKIYSKYENLISSPVDRLDVIVDSGGGDIDSTYHLVMLLRKMSKKGLRFIVPRWAKSAATLLVCGGDEIIMNVTSEIGPLDPQITKIDENEESEEQFSPLCIKQVTDYIDQLYKDGKKELADKLVEKIKLYELGDFMRALTVSPVYIKKILQSRMLRDEKEEKIKEVADILTTGFPHHGHCILMDDAKQIGLKVVTPNKKEWGILWSIWQEYDSTRSLIFEKQRLMSAFVRTSEKENPELVALLRSGVVDVKNLKR